MRALYELQCDPFGVILDLGSHAYRAEGLQPDCVAAGKPAGTWAGRDTVHDLAEEIALHLVFDAAAGIVADEMPELDLFTGGMPKSHFDFDLLHDVLYQDKDYEIAYLSNHSIAKPGDLEEWFEDFQTPAPRNPERGFHR